MSAISTNLKLHIQYFVYKQSFKNHIPGSRPSIAMGGPMITKERALYMLIFMLICPWQQMLLSTAMYDRKYQIKIKSTWLKIYCAF